MVIVDSSVWIQAFRRSSPQERFEVDRLLAQGEALIVGPVFAEVLQGARNSQEFDSLRDRLSALPYQEETIETWVRVGSLSYQLRRRGVALALVDVLIAALAIEGEHSLYTLDDHFQRVPGLKLHKIGVG